MNVIKLKNLKIQLQLAFQYVFSNKEQLVWSFHLHSKMYISNYDFFYKNIEL